MMDREPFVVSKDWLLAFRTPRGGWTRAQIEALGMRWGAVRKGWLERTEGLRISQRRRVQFETGRFVKREFTPRTPAQIAKATARETHRELDQAAALAMDLDH